jgi:hypothetical protein
VNGRDLYNRGISVRNALCHNNGDGTFVDGTDKAGVPGTGYGLGCAWGDYDNDGFPDLFVTQYGRNVLYHNNRNGTFTDVTEKAGVAGLESGSFHSGATFFDYGNGNHFINFKLVGARSNRDAVGARVHVVSGGISQIREIAGGGSYLSQSDLRANFGIGKATIAQTVEVEWPSGQTQTFHDVPGNKFYLIEEDQTELRLQRFSRATPQSPQK